jgi:hypothetical protein
MNIPRRACPIRKGGSVERTLILLLALGTSVLAQQTQKTPIRVDGRPLQVELTSFTSDGQQGYMDLAVVEGSRKVWSSPHQFKPEQPFCFQWGPAGSHTLELGGNLEGSGPEVVIANPQSDVRAPTFRFYRWSHGAFELLREAALIGVDGTRFEYRHGNFPEGAWVDTFKTVSGGQVVAEVRQYRAGMMKTGTARLMPTATGYRLSGWVHPLAVAH